MKNCVTLANRVQCVSALKGALIKKGLFEEGRGLHRHFTVTVIGRNIYNTNGDTIYETKGGGGGQRRGTPTKKGHSQKEGALPEKSLHTIRPPGLGSFIAKNFFKYFIMSIVTTEKTVHHTISQINSF